MRELPRLSLALRRFGTVSLQEDEEQVNDIALRKSLALEKQKERNISWNNLVTFIKKNASVSHSEVAATLKQLLTSAKAIGKFPNFKCYLLCFVSMYFISSRS